MYVGGLSEFQVSVYLLWCVCWTYVWFV